MQHLAGAICALSALCAGLPAQAADVQPDAPGHSSSVRFDETFVATDNLLDDSTKLSDTGVRLRGILVRGIETGIGAVSLEAGVETTDYKTYDFANERAFHAGLRQQIADIGPLSVNTHLGYAWARSGDDLTLAGITLALRQTIQTFSAGGSLKLSLPNDMTAALAVDEEYDRVGKADFVADLPDTQVNPDINTATVTLGLARDTARLHYGATMTMADVALYRQTPLQNAVPYRSYGLRGHLVLDDVGGWKLTGSFGLRRLAEDRGLYDRVRPVYKLIAARRFGDRYGVKASLVTDFDAIDTDDPLATYRHQVELEASSLLGERVALALGGFAGAGDNLLLGNKERRWGAFGQLTLKAGPKLSFLTRLQYVHRHRTVIDADDSTLEAQIGVQSTL